MIFLLLIHLIFYNFFNTSQYLSTFKSYSPPTLKLSNQLLKNYYSDHSNLHEEASKAIILTTLKNLNYQHWIEYIDYIHLIIYQANVLPNKQNELIIVLNLSKDLAVIAFYKPVNQEYIFTNKIENLLPIESLDFLPAPKLGYQLLVAHQVLDERLGAFLIDQFVEVFLYWNHDFKCTWKKSKYRKEIYHAQWLDPASPSNQWIAVVEKNKIRFNKNNNLQISVLLNKQKYIATKEQMPFEKEFKLVESATSKENFYWNDDYKHFIIGEGTMNCFDTQVAIIENTSHSVEYFLGLHSNNYKIITKSGKTLYTPKQFVWIIPNP